MTYHDSIVRAARRGAVLRYAATNSASSNPFRASSLGGCQHKLVLLSDPNVQRVPQGEKSVLTLDHGTLRGAEMVRNLSAGIEAIDDTSHPLYGAKLIAIEHEVLLPMPGEWEPAVIEALRVKLPGLEFRPWGHVNGVANGSEVPVIKGHVDFVVVTADGTGILVDWKTAHPFAWKQRKAEASNGNPDEGYATQLGLYLAALKRTLVDSVKQWGDPCLVYESKDDHEMFVDIVPQDYALGLAKQAAHNTAQTLRRIAVGLGRTVPRAYGPDGSGKLPWQCRYCPVYSTCWSGAITKLEGDPSLPKSIIVNHTAPTYDEINP